MTMLGGRPSSEDNESNKLDSSQSDNKDSVENSDDLPF